MEDQEIKLDISADYQESLKQFMNSLSEFNATELELNFIEGIFEIGYEAGLNDMLNKLKKLQEEYEATGKI